VIGLDTNILLRWLISPDEWDLGSSKSELAAIERTLSAVEAEFFVNAIVVAETTWILEQKLKLGRAVVCDVVDRLLFARNIVVDNAELVMQARQHYEDSNVGFADCLIGGINRNAGCDYTLTFDKRAAHHVGFRNIRARE
jgi:predicted nucleic-acid-binding protein